MTPAKLIAQAVANFVNKAVWPPARRDLEFLLAAKWSTPRIAKLYGHTAAEIAEVKRAYGLAKKSKYGAVRTEVDGVWFDSAKEAARWAQLKYLERAGQIACLERQVRYPLYAATCVQDKHEHGLEEIAVYVADFKYQERKNKLWNKSWVDVVEDSKGIATDVYKIKRKLMLANYGIEIRET